jgi:hypothetical protein
MHHRIELLGPGHLRDAARNARNQGFVLWMTIAMNAWSEELTRRTHYTRLYEWAELSVNARWDSTAMDYPMRPRKPPGVERVLLNFQRFTPPAWFLSYDEPPGLDKEPVTISDDSDDDEVEYLGLARREEPTTPQRHRGMLHQRKRALSSDAEADAEVKEHLRDPLPDVRDGSHHGRPPAPREALPPRRARSPRALLQR